MNDKTKLEIKELLKMYIFDKSNTVYFLHYDNCNDYDFFKVNPLKWRIPIVMIKGMTLYAFSLDDIIIDNIKTKKYRQIISLCLDNALFKKIFKVKDNNYNEYIIAEE